MLCHVCSFLVHVLHPIHPYLYLQFSFYVSFFPSSCYTTYIPFSYLSYISPHVCVCVCVFSGLQSPIHRTQHTHLQNMEIHEKKHTHTAHTHISLPHRHRSIRSNFYLFFPSLVIVKISTCEILGNLPIPLTNIRSSPESHANRLRFFSLDRHTRCK